MLAEHLLPLLRHVWRLTAGQGYLFPAARAGRADRHLSPRTIERVVERARRLSGVTKRATPHSLRHSFATHLIESGTDIRFIQKLLGHTHLETTSLYTKVAVGVTANVCSPLDQIKDQSCGRTEKASGPARASVGRMSLWVEPTADATGTRRVRLVIDNSGDRVPLPGVTVTEPRPGWVNLQIPSIETWEPSLARLTPAQRERIQAVEFFELLQREVVRRLPGPAP